MGSRFLKRVLILRPFMVAVILLAGLGLTPASSSYATHPCQDYDPFQCQHPVDPWGDCVTTLQPVVLTATDETGVPIVVGEVTMEETVCVEDGPMPGAPPDPPDPLAPAASLYKGLYCSYHTPARAAWRMSNGIAERKWHFKTYFGGREIYSYTRPDNIGCPAPIGTVAHCTYESRMKGMAGISYQGFVLKSNFSHINIITAGCY